MTPRQGPTCEICGATTGPGVQICTQCLEFQQPAAAAASAMRYAVSCAGCKECGSSVVQIRRKTASNGVPMVAFQCLTCGRAASQWLKREAVPNLAALPEWDEQLSGEFWRKKRADDASRFEANRDLRQVEYASYLQSPRWKGIRARVMKRAGGICEGCGLVPASEVHHLTYDNVGDELLFQLVALCEDCHEKVHRKQAAA